MKARRSDAPGSGEGKEGMLCHSSCRSREKGSANERWRHSAVEERKRAASVKRRQPRSKPSQTEVSTPYFLPPNQPPRRPTRCEISLIRRKSPEWPLSPPHRVGSAVARRESCVRTYSRPALPGCRVAGASESAPLRVGGSSWSVGRRGEGCDGGERVYLHSASLATAKEAVVAAGEGAEGDRRSRYECKGEFRLIRRRTCLIATYKGERRGR